MVHFRKALNKNSKKNFNVNRTSYLGNQGSLNLKCQFCALYKENTVNNHKTPFQSLTKGTCKFPCEGSQSK